MRRIALAIASKAWKRAHQPRPIALLTAQSMGKLQTVTDRRRAVVTIGVGGAGCRRLTFSQRLNLAPSLAEDQGCFGIPESEHPAPVPHAQRTRIPHDAHSLASIDAFTSVRDF